MGHECSIVGCGGKFWPRPTFVVVAEDRPDDPIVAKSASGAWKSVRCCGLLSRPPIYCVGSCLFTTPHLLLLPWAYGDLKLKCALCNVLAARCRTGMQVQDRLNAGIVRRLAAGERLQGPSKQQLSGTVFFGLTAPHIITAIETLDPDHTCTIYWDTQHVRPQLFWPAVRAAHVPCIHPAEPTWLFQSV